MDKLILFLIYFSLISCHSQNSESKISHSSTFSKFGVVKDQQNIQENLYVSDFQLLQVIEFGQDNQFEKYDEGGLHIPSDLKLFNDTLYILSRIENSVFMLDVKRNLRFEDSVLNRSMRDSHYWPLNLDVNLDYIGIDFRREFVIYDRKKKELIFEVSPIRIEDFTFLPENSMVFKKDFKDSLYFCRYEFETGEFNLFQQVELARNSSIPLISSPEGLVLFGRSPEAINHYLHRDQKTNQFFKSATVDSLFVDKYQYLESVFGSNYAYLLYNEGRGKILIWDKKTGRSIFIEFPDEISPIKEHESIANDLCDRNKIFCTSLRIGEKYGILVFSKNQKLFIYKFDFVL